MTNGLKMLADYVYLSKYAQKKNDGSLETWDESVDRIYDMHELYLTYKGYDRASWGQMLEKARGMEKQKLFLSSQRARQFAEPVFDKGILKHHAKLYNCSSTLVDRPRVFSEAMYLLLAGCGVGYSVKKVHVNKLPKVADRISTVAAHYVIGDSIEGWAEAIEVLMDAAFGSGQIPIFDYNAIRPKGSLISGKFRAPGPEPLRKAINNVIGILQKAEGRQLRPFECHRILCFIAESVISGGVRRSAMISIFDKDDEEMIYCKIGNKDWWKEGHNPELAMANNSIGINFGEELPISEFKRMWEYICQGDPGFIRTESDEYTANPCAEIVQNPIITYEDGSKVAGFAFCNLVEINGDKITIDNYKEIIEIATFVATVQALYTDFKYLSKASKDIAVRDSAIGVSITGLMSNPIFMTSEGIEVMTNGAKIVLDVNEKWAKIFGIPASKRCTTVKPSGNASCILDGIAPGIHPAHDSRYLRRVQISDNSPEYLALKDTPLVAWTGMGYVLSFPICIEGYKGALKDTLGALDHVKFIGRVKHFWVNKGCREEENGKKIPNNVSATVQVLPEEKESLMGAIYTNSHILTGITFLDKFTEYYKYLPYSSLLTQDEVDEYNAIVDYLENNEVDFYKILADVQPVNAGELAAIACAGGSCEIR